MNAQVQQGNPPTMRVDSLDLARGLMLVVSVAVNAWIGAPAWFEHAPWIGVHPIDLVFPTFVTLSGAGLGIAYARRVRPLREARRVVVLWAAGVAYTALLAWLATGHVDWSTFDATGVLQLYAAIVLGIVLLRVVCRRWWQWLCAGVTLAAAQAVWLATWAAGCPQQTLTPECNPSRVIDVAVFGAAHIYVEGTRGHDPGGLVVLIGALATAACGAAAGRVILDHARGGTTRAFLQRGVVAVTAPLLAAALTAQWVPPFKRLWTAPFALGIAATIAAALLLMHLLADTHTPGRLEQGLRYPLIALGRNSLLVYFGSHALRSVLTIGTPQGENLQRDLATWLGAPEAAWPLCLAAVLAWTILAVVLHRLRIYIKA